jgi:hypothetical protein
MYNVKTVPVLLRWFLSYLSFLNRAPSSLCLASRYLKPYLDWWQWVGITTSSFRSDSSPQEIFRCSHLCNCLPYNSHCQHNNCCGGIDPANSNSSFVNTVTKNVSNIFHSQNDLNRDLQEGILKLQEELNLTEETLTGIVQYIQLTCDSWYSNICITAAQWNGTYHNWTLIHYIQGAWTQNSIIHIQHLTKDILDLQAAHLCLYYLSGLHEELARET